MSRVIRSPEKQIQHKKKRRVVSVLVLLCFAGFVWLAVYVPSLPSLQVKNIIVRGAAVLTEEEVQQRVKEELSGKYLYVFPKTNVFLYPQKPIEESLLAAFPRIASVSANLDTERILTITLTEREPFALWCGREIPFSETDKTCAYIDEKGFVFAKAPNFSGRAYFELYGTGMLPPGDPIGHNFLPVETYQNIVRIKKRLEGFQVKPVTVLAETDGGATFATAGGYKIRFNVDQDISSLESNMQAVFRAGSWGGTAASGALEYLDFRFGNKVYYKFRGQE
ncbi:MAG: FtsQ-type POTRA domain-containing protein [Parcubacteria group bacterium]|nr:FtsQ-type POTRA domain-containing protein [Parcubacteria group bacterium]